MDFGFHVETARPASIGRFIIAHPGPRARRKGQILLWAGIFSEQFGRDL
jgi:hypothetical protein